MKEMTRVLRSGAEVSLTELPISGVKAYVQKPVIAVSDSNETSIMDITTSSSSDSICAVELKSVHSF